MSFCCTPIGAPDSSVKFIWRFRRLLIRQYVTAPEEAFPTVADGSAVAFALRESASLPAQNGVTVRPLNEPTLKVKTCLVCRAEDDSKIASERPRAHAQDA